MSLLLSVLLQAAREEVVEVPGEKLKIPLIHLPVEGTSLRPYALAKFETTWGEFHRFYREDLTGGKRSFEGVTRPTLGMAWLGQVQCPEELLEDGQPFIQATWHTAMAYCDWLTAKTGRKFRPPTNAEWEHAARAGDKGGGADFGWHRGNSGGRTRKPGTSTPNAWGLHDMLGNVWELVLEPAEPGALAPVWRGGAWNSPTSFAARQPVAVEWYVADPNRPRSLWWWTGGFCQGLRVACLGGVDAASLAKIDAKVVKSVEKRVPASAEAVSRGAGRSADLFRRATVEVRNGGPSAILELELRVFFLTPKGEPHLLDLEGLSCPGRPTYTWAYPACPIGPGETRSVEIDVPETTDDEPDVDPKAHGAKVTWVRLAP